MKILFIQSPYSYLDAEIIVGKYFPLGIGYLAAYLRQHGHTAQIFQPERDDNLYNELFSLIDDFRPEVVGISVMTPTYPNAVSLCKAIKGRYDCWTVMGGHHVSATGNDVLEQSPATDFVVIGEGESTILELVKELETSSPNFKCVDGLVWRDNEGVVHQNKNRQFINDLDSLPFPARDLVDLSKFRLHSYIDFGKRSTTMITSRGCPFNCNFCSSHLAMGYRYRLRSAENVLAEIEEITNKYGIDHIVFEDDTMTLKRDRIEAICEGLMRMPNKLSWYCITRVDAMNKDLAKIMKRAGCKMVGFGIESGSPEILKKIKKKISIQKAIEAVHACTEAGMRTQCTFIVGFPFDTQKTMEMTLEAAKKINPTLAIFFPLTPYPGTEIFDNFLKDELRPRDVESWANYIVTSNNSGVSVNEQYSGHELKDLANLWNRRFYFRPNQILNITRTIQSWSDFINIFRGFLYLVQKVFSFNK